MPPHLLTQKKKGAGPVWWVLLLLLSISGLLQLAWLERHTLVNDPQGKQLISMLCNIAGCTPPQQRAPKQFRVLSRDMTSHPTHENALLFLLVMANHAEFEQPYPYLQLNLFDDKRRPAGQRVFSPEEYLGEQPSPDLLKPDHAVYIRLQLFDPGPGISGFEIKFL